jgi:hypothetical protein|tara:strand:+ start:333 stop:602 length:270 start_codon:yes stop_codon:yes gene_type:complete
MKKEIQEEPHINVVQNHWNYEFTLALKNFDIQDGASGYTKEDIQELIGLLERGVYHLNNCIEDYERENDGKKIKERKCKGCPETTGRID